MPRGPLRANLLTMAEREGVPVDDVLVADASRRTTTVNAYVSGIQKSIETSMENALTGKGDVLGVAFTLNGRIESAEVYGAAGLFRQMWPKLLRTAIPRPSAAVWSPGSLCFPHAGLPERAVLRPCEFGERR